MSKVFGMISAVLTRPQMYTLHGTFGEVVAFLEGYYSGAAIFRMNEPAVLVWGEFSRFLSATYNFRSGFVMDEFLNKFGADALNELKEAYDKFISTYEGTLPG